MSFGVKNSLVSLDIVMDLDNVNPNGDFLVLYNF